MSITPTFSGEVQLAGWSETHTGGCKVTLWLSSSEELDAFRALTVRKGNTAGHRFMVAMVEIGDDEQPVQPADASTTPGTDVESDEPEPIKPKGGALAKLSGIWCGDTHFQAWLRSVYSRYGEAATPACAANIVRIVCGVDSRAELDSNTLAAQLFQERIRGPYMRHCIATGVTA